jgi:hypothetical protein
MADRPPWHGLADSSLLKVYCDLRERSLANGQSASKLPAAVIGYDWRFSPKALPNDQASAALTARNVIVGSCVCLERARASWVDCRWRILSALSQNPSAASDAYRDGWYATALKATGSRSGVISLAAGVWPSTVPSSTAKPRKPQSGPAGVRSQVLNATIRVRLRSAQRAEKPSQSVVPAERATLLLEEPTLPASRTKA